MRASEQRVGKLFKNQNSIDLPCKKVADFVQSLKWCGSEGDHYQTAWPETTGIPELVMESQGRDGEGSCLIQDQNRLDRGCEIRGNVVSTQAPWLRNLVSLCVSLRYWCFLQPESREVVSSGLT